MANAREIAPLLGRARELTTGYLDGGAGAFKAYTDLLSFIFGLTVLDVARSGIRSHRSDVENKRVIASLAGPHKPLRLMNGAFLRFNINVYLGETDKAPGKQVLKVEDESYQYQLDEGAEKWIFRYEYVRAARSDPHPPAHLHINGDLRESVPLMGGSKPLGKVHFPTGRVSVPAIIRLLAEQFGVACNADAWQWRPTLGQVEADFHEIAHQPLSGPSA